MSAQSPESGNGESKKPKDTPFSQQKLPAWQPILTAGTVLPAFFVIGIAFVAIGVGLLYFTNNIKEKEIDYTDCLNVLEAEKDKPCHEVIKDLRGKELNDKCKCKVEIELEEDWNNNVYLYYGLTNFYQNHRRYVKSRDELQLLGNIDKEPSDDCSGYSKDGDKKIVPCGAIANSLFNDVIKLKYRGGDKNGEEVPLIRQGIAWESDKQYKFKNPEILGDKTLEDYLKEKNTAKPKDWNKELWELDPDNKSNNGLQNEDLIVWMRTAAFPNFRKLHRIIEQKLPKGNYTLEIDYNYRVKSFSGTKSIVLSQVSILGGKNAFLPISYIVVGGLCSIIGIAFLIIHVKFGKLSNDLMGLENRN